jgi:hypothetical protein
VGWNVLKQQKQKKDTDVWRQPLALTEVCSQAKAACPQGSRPVDRRRMRIYEYGLGWMNGCWRGNERRGAKESG